MGTYFFVQLELLIGFCEQFDAVNSERWVLGILRAESNLEGWLLHADNLCIAKREIIPEGASWVQDEVVSVHDLNCNFGWVVAASIHSHPYADDQVLRFRVQLQLQSKLLLRWFIDNWFVTAVWFEDPRRTSNKRLHIPVHVHVAP